MQAVGTTPQSAPRGLMPQIGLLALAVVVAASTIAVGPLALLPIFGILFFALIVARPEYGIALFLSTFLMEYPRALQGAGFLTINNVLGGLFLVLLTYKVYQEGDWWFLGCPEIQLLAFIILVYYMANRLNGPDPRLMSMFGLAEQNTSDSIRTFASRAAFTLFFINFIRSPEHVRMIYLLAITFMVISALMGLQGVLHGGGMYGYRANTRGGVIAAAFNPNRLAMFAILAIAGLWYLMRSLHFPGLRLMIIPTIVVLALAVVMTASRSGLLGLGLCVAAIVLDERASLRTMFSFGLAGMLLLLLAVQFVPQKTLDRITNLPGTEAGESGLGSGSIERREYGWGIAFELFEDHPLLGVGMGNWEISRFLKDPKHTTAAPHSSYLLAVVEGGVLCLAALLALLWRTWRNLRFAERYLSDPSFPLADLNWIVKGSKVGLIVLVFFSLFADLWQLVILFWLIGLSIVVRRLVEAAELERAMAY